jgi:hypothetical protein
MRYYFIRRFSLLVIGRGMHIISSYVKKKSPFFPGQFYAYNLHADRFPAAKTLCRAKKEHGRHPGYVLTPPSVKIYQL